MQAYELTDFEWGVIAPLLPNKPRGVPRVDDRRVLDGIFWVLRTGAPWRALPKEFGLRESDMKAHSSMRILVGAPSGQGEVCNPAKSGLSPILHTRGVLNFRCGPLRTIA